jgi:uncharacterized protein with von Willebrand factor type A (vWA) domain
MRRTEVLRTRRIVRLNPVLSWQGDEPVTRGIVAAAVPHVDLFASRTTSRASLLEPYLVGLWAICSPRDP